jgi:hypothetical protein
MSAFGEMSPSAYHVCVSLVCFYHVHFIYGWGGEGLSSLHTFPSTYDEPHVGEGLSVADVLLVQN